MGQSTIVQHKRFVVGILLMLFVVYFYLFYHRHWLSSTWFYDASPVKKYSTTETHIGTALHWIRTLRNEAVNPRLLILVLTKDQFSWGRNSNSPPRTFQSFLNMINSAPFSARNLSLGLLTSSKLEYVNYTKTLEMMTTSYELFARASIIYHAGFDKQKRNVTLDGNREGRHDDSVQKERRRLLARLRNYLMLSSLQFEDHIVWFDADVYISSDNLLQTFIEQSTNSKAKHDAPIGVLTARCRLDGDPHSNYDRNAWLGPRQVPNRIELDILRKGGIFVPRPTGDTQMLHGLLKGTLNSDLIKLDSVGGTVLYIKADLVRQGLIFPPYYVIGTEWTMKEGWDGIETEGLCYIAMNLGYGCYALGGDWVITHTNH